MNDETADLVFGLAESARMQLAAVEQATQAMQVQRRDLRETITLMQRTQAAIAMEAGRGMQQGVKGIGAEVNASLRTEVDKAKSTLSDMTEELRGAAAMLSWRWTLGLLIAGLLFGLALGWIIWGMNIGYRLDAIEQTLQRQAAPALPAAPVHAHRHLRRGR